jgi:polysaccharide biosynthesis protein PslH
MKILWVKADRLLPVQNGGNIRSYHIARYLAKRHQLTFFSYYDGAQDADYEAQLENEFPGSVCLGTGKPELDTLRRALDYVRHLPASTPYAVRRFLSPAVTEKLRQWFEDRSFDVVVCDFLDAAVNFPATLTIPTVLFQHNVESEIWRRHASNGPGWAKRMAYGLEFSKMQRYEQEMMRRFHHVIAVSENDRKLMGAWVDPSRIGVVATGVDLRQFRPDLSSDDQASTDQASNDRASNERASTATEPLVMFVGAMDWMPNVDAVEYFCEEIWPAIVKRMPAARFRIVGRNPVPRVLKLGSGAVEVTGRVPSVVEHLREATVVVVPLRVGGGTRLKIYEAMAMGRAVVATSVGAEGLDVRHGEDIVLADDPARFSEAVATLLEDVPRRRELEQRAAESAARFDWPAVAATFEQILQRQSLASMERIQPGPRDTMQRVASQA